MADNQPQPRRARGKNRALPGFLLLFLSTAEAADETPLPCGAGVLESYANAQGEWVFRRLRRKEQETEYKQVEISTT